MAEGRRFVCNHCGRKIEAWDEGNPYFINEKGKKEYAYHPDWDKLALCIGNDTPHICLDCGARFKVDSEKPISACRKCHSTRIIDLCELEGQPCPYCKAGIFAIDPNTFVIS